MQFPGLVEFLRVALCVKIAGHVGTLTGTWGDGTQYTTSPATIQLGGGAKVSTSSNETWKPGPVGNLQSEPWVELPIATPGNLSNAVSYVFVSSCSHGRPSSSSSLQCCYMYLQVCPHCLRVVVGKRPGTDEVTRSMIANCDGCFRRRWDDSLQVVLHRREMLASVLHGILCQSPFVRKRPRDSRHSGHLVSEDLDLSFFLGMDFSSTWELECWKDEVAAFVSLENMRADIMVHA